MNTANAAGGFVTRRHTQWCIRVTYPTGDEALLRHGARIGAGSVVRFRTRRDADVNLDFITQGLDAGTVATVIRYTPDLEQLT